MRKRKEPVEKVKKVKENVVRDEKGNKLCPIHLKRHLMVPETHPSYTGLCCHPDCIGKQISNIVKGSRTWTNRIKLFHYLQIWDDFVSYIYEQLLKEAEKQHKPTVINFHWFRYKIAEFTHREMQRGYAVIGKIPLAFRPDTIHTIQNVYDKDVIDREYDFFIDKGILGDATSHTFSKEIFDFITDNYGKEWSLLVAGEITPNDIARLVKMPINLVRRKEKMIFREIVREFIEEEKVQEMWKEFALDGTQPLKPSLSVKKEKEKLEVRHWTTLADKANQSAGLPVRENHYQRLIRHKQEELSNLKKKVKGAKNVSISIEESEETEEP